MCKRPARSPPLFSSVHGRLGSELIRTNRSQHNLGWVVNPTSLSSAQSTEFINQYTRSSTVGRTGLAGEYHQSREVQVNICYTPYFHYMGPAGEGTLRWIDFPVDDRAALQDASPRKHSRLLRVYLRPSTFLNLRTYGSSGITPALISQAE
ncbi:hypothetical protein BD779DRAFT_1679318 [Infundibulicybe gibba]|nr:hypothetical protein BD779DRAFT_1679318 [Infundibulicybe gibba]